MIPCHIQNCRRRRSPGLVGTSIIVGLNFWWGRVIALFPGKEKDDSIQKQVPLCPELQGTLDVSIKTNYVIIFRY